MTQSTHPKKLYLLSTIGALIEGIYDGNTTYADLAAHGDFGIGTFNALDGEMIAFDGKFYQATADGVLHDVDHKSKCPYAVLTHFSPDASLTVDDSHSFEMLLTRLDESIRSHNTFQAIRIDALFSSVTVRIVPRQCIPYPKLTEIARQQPTYEYHGIKGTMAGFRFPRYANQIGLGGYHIHFVDACRKVGGHVIDAVTKEATIQISEIDRVRLDLLDTTEFLETDLDKDYAHAVNLAEK